METAMKLERQHAKLTHASEVLNTAMDHLQDNPDPTNQVHKNFIKILKLTAKHLARVDSNLYPQIQLIRNRKLRRNLSRIITRSGHVRTEVQFLIKSWTAKRARKHPHLFRSVVWHFLAILNMRLTGEQRIFGILNRCEIPASPPAANIGMGQAL